ncbi:MAG: putative membrane protein [Polyangiales bacterium]|jgi:putative membrane protein
MLATAAVWLVIVLHILFGLAESVGWNGMAKRFGYKPEAIVATKALALNQGAYNAGFAALLAWALVSGEAATVIALLVFILAMSIVGALSVRWTIFVIQGVPAVAALALSLL